MFEGFIRKLEDGNFITLEVTPLHSATLQDVIHRLERLKIYSMVDGFSVTDNPLAKLKYNSLFAAIKLQKHFNKPALATMTMRDRNKIALQSELLGANDFGVRAILALTGDSAKMSDQPNTKGVFESDSLMLLDIIKCFNAGIDYAGREFKQKPKKIFPFAVTNSFAKKEQVLLKRLKKKIEHGARGIISQPVFDIENAKKLLEIFEEAKKNFSNEKAKAKMILGFFPITRLKTAQFLASHVPGIYVPPSLIDKLYKALKISPQKEYETGFKWSKELFEKLYQLYPRVHLMSANRFEVLKEILS
jgi:5,10-methylenetetrahydrofolate reductase